MQLQLGWHERCFYGISPRLFSQDAAILAFVFFRCLCCLFQPATFFHLASSVCWFSDHRFLLNIPPVLMNFNLILIVVALIDKKNTSKASDCVSSHRLVCLEYAQTELDTVGLYWRDAHDNIQYKCYFLPEYLLLRVQHDIYTFIFNYLWSYSQHFHLKSAEKKKWHWWNSNWKSHNRHNLHDLQSAGTTFKNREKRTGKHPRVLPPLREEWM